MNRVRRTLGVGLVLSTYFILLAPFGYAAFAIWAALPTKDPRRRAHRIQKCMGFAFGSMHVALRWMRIVDFNPKEVEGQIPDEPCVLVSNHPTLMDISSILATEANLIFPVKASLFRTFWARPMFEAADQLHIPQGDPFAVGGVVQVAAQRLAQGYRLIIFPEGTRSPADGLHRFGRMAFEIAVREKVPIVPLIITCEPRWLSPGRSFFSSEVKTVPKIRIRVLPAIYPDDVDKDDSQGTSSRALRDRVSRLIHRELGLPLPPRLGDPGEHKA